MVTVKRAAKYGFCSGVRVADIKVRRFANSGGTAVRLDLHCQRNQIAGNHIEHLGGAGILLAGYGPGTKDANRSALRKWGAWVNALGHKEYGRPLFVVASADLAGS